MAGTPKRKTSAFGRCLSLSTKSTGSLARASTCEKGCSLLRRTSSGQSPHRSSWPDGQASLRFLAPPLPNKPASLGFVWGPDSHACSLRSVFPEAHVPGKNRLDLIPSSADDGTLRGSFTKPEAFLLFRQAETSAFGRCLSSAFGRCLSFWEHHNSINVAASRIAPQTKSKPSEAGSIGKEEQERGQMTSFLL